MLQRLLCAVEASRIGLAVSSGRTIRVRDMAIVVAWRFSWRCARRARPCRRGRCDLHAVQFGVDAVAASSSSWVPCSATTPSLSTMILLASRIVRQAVRDGDDRAPFHQPLEPLDHEPLGFGVERGGRLVEDQDRRVADDGARDADALALATRQRESAFADHRVVAVRHAR